MEAVEGQVNLGNGHRKQEQPWGGEMGGGSAPDQGRHAPARPCQGYIIYAPLVPAVSICLLYHLVSYDMTTRYS
jgi:hypothetical protein